MITRQSAWLSATMPLPQREKGLASAEARLQALGSWELDWYHLGAEVPVATWNWRCAGPQMWGLHLCCDYTYLSWVLQLSVLDYFVSALWLNLVCVLARKWVFYFTHLGLNCKPLLCPNADTFPPSSVSAMLEFWCGTGLCGPIVVLNDLDMCIINPLCIFVHVFLGETALCHPCSHLKFLECF